MSQINEQNLSAEAEFKKKMDECQNDVELQKLFKKNGFPGMTYEQFCKTIVSQYIDTPQEDDPAVLWNN